MVFVWSWFSSPTYVSRQKHCACPGVPCSCSHVSSLPLWLSSPYTVWGLLWSLAGIILTVWNKNVFNMSEVLWLLWLWEGFLVKTCYGVPYKHRIPESVSVTDGLYQHSGSFFATADVEKLLVKPGPSSRKSWCFAVPRPLNSTAPVADDSESQRYQNVKEKRWNPRRIEAGLAHHRVDAVPATSMSFHIILLKSSKFDAEQIWSLFANLIKPP